ncbi:urease accessory protein UreD [Crenobacter sp. SG2303]|uniref:Urease accessory protein UreD n=1 Tax=Crenobacter oryzisoli TaxID=3056844 RepID=A0ABT7XKQ1_9NEIS|nr:urease accessory protein UreD [Crenobacter sp. SG2303]MDN0074361.1 urease accessory protein UreD [Crenobacter sp. SG2303]
MMLSTPMHRDLPTAATGLLPGWSARLELAYARHGERTIPVHRRHFGPLRVQKHFHPEPSGGVCHQIIVHPPGGIAGGDALAFAIALEPGAHALLTSPGAAKWYRAHGRAASQTLNARLAEGAVLEWLPQETILFDGSDTSLHNHFELAGDARLVYSDVVCLGRPAAGERFATGQWRQDSRIVRDGRLIWAEPLRLAGSDPLLTSRIGLAGHSVVGTLLFAGPKLPAELTALCRELVADGLLAISQLPELWVARFLGDSAEAAHSAFRQLWRLIRPEAVGLDAVAPRIWNT